MACLHLGKLLAAALLLISFFNPILAAPTKDVDTTALDARQIITANPIVSCCTDCAGAYGDSVWFNVLDNFCGWAGGYLDLWATERYFTTHQYCEPGSSHCIYLSIQFNCDPPGHIGYVTYSGCMGYFNYARNPAAGCGGPPFSGCKVTSAGGCWTFQATAGAAPAAASLSDVQLNASASPVDLPIPDHKWGAPIQMN